MRRNVLIGAGLLVTTIALGASREIVVGKATYHVDTGTEGGGCLTMEVGNGAEETLCRDGDDFAALSSVDGCLDSAGSGYCAFEKRRDGGPPGSALTCVSGDEYVLLVGPSANCSLSQGEKTCESPDGNSSATADCKVGCLKTTGAGSCCSPGKDCPPAPGIKP